MYFKYVFQILLFEILYNSAQLSVSRFGASCTPRWCTASRACILYGLRHRPIYRYVVAGGQFVRRRDKSRRFDESEITTWWELCTGRRYAKRSSRIPLHPAISSLRILLLLPPLNYCTDDCTEFTSERVLTNQHLLDARAGSTLRPFIESHYSHYKG